MKHLLPILCLFIFSCDSGGGDESMEDLDNNSHENNYPNIVILDIDFDKTYANHPPEEGEEQYDLLQATFHVINNGDVPSLDFEFYINPCAGTSNIDGGWPINWDRIYIPSLEPGEGYIAETESQPFCFWNAMCSITNSDCSSIYPSSGY